MNWNLSQSQTCKSNTLGCGE